MKEDKESKKVLEAIDKVIEENTVISIRKEVFNLANRLAMAGFGGEAVIMHQIHNRMIDK